ncbi:MAG: radical SAM protein [Candidatus Omnitrophica bacterium]|nr:radical SAM protein [Candidatus Omnitrophota bacterium]
MKYKHALFLNPYIESTATSIMRLFPPTGLEYVATSARGLADTVTLLDLRYENELTDIDKLMAFIVREIDIVFVGIGWDRQFEEIVKLLNRMPDGPTLVVGGYKATEEVETLFKRCPTIDIIVRGEGEMTTREILLGVPLPSILGLSYRTAGAVVHNGNRPLQDVDTIPAPDRRLRRNTYHMTLNGINVTNLSWDSVLSARGCPYTCKFCTFSLNPLGQKRDYAARSVDSVIEEIQGLSADAILFSDDNFFANPKRAEQICDAIIARGIRKRFIAQARIEIARYPQLLEKIVKAGFKILLIGLESPHDRILAQMNKGFDSKTIRQAFKVLKKYPIYYHGYFIYGNIGETEEEMIAIATFAKEIRVDSITFQKLRIEKFSPLKELALATPGYHVTDTGALYSDTYSHARLKKIGRRIKFLFYTPWCLLKIAHKLLAIRLFTLREFASFLQASPRLLRSIIVREVAKGRLGDTLKRALITND